MLKVHKSRVPRPVLDRVWTYAGVRIPVKREDFPPHQRFIVDLPQYGIHHARADINQLYRVVTARLQQRMAVKWESVLCVEFTQQELRLPGTVSGVPSPTRGQLHVVITWRRMQLAEIDGQRVHRLFVAHVPEQAGQAAYDRWGCTSPGWPSAFGTFTIEDTPKAREILAKMTDSVSRRISISFAAVVRRLSQHQRGHNGPRPCLTS